jgi:hypothetical protein
VPSVAVAWFLKFFGWQKSTGKRSAKRLKYTTGNGATYSRAHGYSTDRTLAVLSMHLGYI